MTRGTTLPTRSRLQSPGVGEPGWTQPGWEQPDTAPIRSEPRPDVDSQEHIAFFVDRFYERVLDDEDLRPIFIDVAGIELSEHLPRIKAYWGKLLLGERNYRRHTMNIHRAVHDQRSFAASDFQRWLNLFTLTMDEYFEGPKAQRAKTLAANIAANMQKSL